jgi:hypothetical protein
LLLGAVAFHYMISVGIQSHGRQAEIDSSGAAFTSLAFIFVVTNTINVGTYVPVAFIQVTTVIRCLLSTDVRDSTSSLSVMLTILLCSGLDDQSFLVYYCHRCERTLLPFDIYMSKGYYIIV